MGPFVEPMSQEHVPPYEIRKRATGAEVQMPRLGLVLEIFRVETLQPFL
jgi:hypothetical protein